MVMNPWIPQNLRNFLTSLGTTKSSRTFLLSGEKPLAATEQEPSWTPEHPDILVTRSISVSAGNWTRLSDVRPGILTDWTVNTTEGHEIYYINAQYSHRHSFKYNQQDATLHNILYCCQCFAGFRRFLRPSSGAQELYTQHLVHARLASLARTRCCVYSSWAPDDGRNRPKHVEHW